MYRRERASAKKRPSIDDAPPTLTSRLHFPHTQYVSVAERERSTSCDGSSSFDQIEPSP